MRQIHKEIAVLGDDASKIAFYGKKPLEELLMSQQLDEHEQKSVYKAIEALNRLSILNTCY